MSEFHRLLQRRSDGKLNNIIAVCGAGLSAASGIPTFRGAGGMWRKYDAMSLATPEAFEDNPSLVWQFYHYRREAARKAHPNSAHLALATFSVPSLREVAAPNSKFSEITRTFTKFSIITQNVDGLSLRALATTLREQTKIGTDSSTIETAPLLEMHGRIFDVKCTSPSCGHVEYNTSSPICPALAAVEEVGADNTLHMDLDIPESELPRCSRCKALARPGVVWFGEQPQEMDRIDKLVEEADLCLVVGTSSTVYPAAAYASLVQMHGGKVAVFNLERSEGDTEADFLFIGPCEETLPKALGIVAL
ncbi:NAD-dependent protein deacylase [Mycena galericulata]|nr:NAD-dependent protein deacylase [Mycena galericulata]